MLRELGRGIHQILLLADMALCIALFSALAYHPFFADGIGIGAYGPAAIGVMAIATGLAWQILLGRFGVYESQRRISFNVLVTRMLLADAVGAGALATLLVIFGVKQSALLPLALGAGMFATQVAMRIVSMTALRIIRKRGLNFRNMVIVGSGPRARHVTDTITQHPEWGQRVVGYLDDGAADFSPVIPVEKIHKFNDLPMLLRTETVDEVLVACPRSMLAELTPVVRECASVGIPVTFLADLFGDQLPVPHVGTFGALTTLSFAPVHHNELELMVKRGIDLVGATVGVILSLPVIAVAAAMIRLTTSGPVFFRQVRCGLNGRRFEMIKLRTMDVGAEGRKQELMHLNEMDGPVFKIDKDPRVTRVGAFLRHSSIDELPQFWNILRGDMSLVGPRPPTPDEVLHYQGDTRRRLSMRPGLTCYWQVSGRSNIGFADWIKLDLMYIDTWSLMNDFFIIVRTIPTVLLRRGAS